MNASSSEALVRFGLGSNRAAEKIEIARFRIPRTRQVHAKRITVPTGAIDHVPPIAGESRVRDELRRKRQLLESWRRGRCSHLISTFRPDYVDLS
jgi:hypothetical protein